MKLVYHNETKRIQIPKSYIDLQKMSNEAFNLTSNKNFKFYYVDLDSDIITISDQNDFM